MIQIATFELPSEQDKANEFLKTHKPAGEIHFNRDMAFVFYDDGSWPVEYQIADLQEMIGGQRGARLQQEIALHVMKSELADLSPRHNKGRYEEVANGIHQTQKALDIQDLKIKFVQGKIDALRTKVD